MGRESIHVLDLETFESHYISYYGETYAEETGKKEVNNKNMNSNSDPEDEGYEDFHWNHEDDDDEY